MQLLQTFGDFYLVSLTAIQTYSGFFFSYEVYFSEKLKDVLIVHLQDEHQKIKHNLKIRH